MADMLNFDQKSAGSSEPGSAESQESLSSRCYSSDDVAEIIRLSLLDEAGRSENSVDHEELIAIGKEFGVNHEQIERSIGLLEEERRAKDKERFLWMKFKAHCFLFGAVSSLCIFINIMTGMETFWSAYVLFGMGLFVLGHYAGLRYAPDFVELAMERTRHLANSKYGEFFEDDVNVNFLVSDSMGLSETRGMLHLEDDHLMVEYQMADSILGVFKTRVREMEIRLEDITRVRLERKIWTSEFVLQGRSLKVVGHLPGHTAGSLKLRINRQSQNAAQQLVDRISEKIRQ